MLEKYEVGFICTDCFIQKNIDNISGVLIKRLCPTGSKGQIYNARHLLNEINFSFTQSHLKAAINNFCKTGQNVAIVFKDIVAESYETAIVKMEPDAELIAGALAIHSANPVNLLCAYSKGIDSGVNFYFPNNRMIWHATNVAGFFDATPKLIQEGFKNPKLGLLLRLYRASLRERDDDYRMLLQLILLEEASDCEKKDTFAERLRDFCVKYEILGLMNNIANDPDIQFELPLGKDMVDVLVKLRNAVVHNGDITKDTIKQFNGEWLYSLLEKKSALHKLVGENIRFLLCSMVGLQGTLVTAKKDGEIFEIKFN